MNDIELTQEWTPIGSDGSYAFEGTFQGNGHTISGLNIENSENKNQGFFGSLKGTVNNLKLKGSIETTSDNAGGIAAYLTDTATVENCTVEVNVSGRDRIGGVAGYSFGGTIINCHSLGNVKGNVKVGGVLGENWNGTVKKCSNPVSYTHLDVYKRQRYEYLRRTFSGMGGCRLSVQPKEADTKMCIRDRNWTSSVLTYRLSLFVSFFL